MDAAQAGTWEWDLATGRSVWSDKLWTLYGLIPHACEPSYEAWRQTVHPEDRDATERALQEVVRQEGELRLEWRVLDPAAGERWLMTQGRPLRDASGRATHYLGVVMDITARKQEQAELRRWADAFEHCAHGIALGLPGANRVMVCNAAFARMIGRPAGEITGRPVLSLYDPADHERIKARIAEADRVGQVRYLSRIVRADGSTFPVQMDTVSVRDADGTVLYRVATAQDITERHRAEEAVHRSEEQYRNLFDNMAEEVHFWQLVRDAAGRIETWRLVDANPPALKSWGRHDIEEIRGKTTDEIFGPGATEHYRAVVEKIFAEGVPHSFEDYLPHLGRHFRFTSVPLGGHFITTGADITAIKQVSAALRESEERYRVATDAGRVAVWRMDLAAGRFETDGSLERLIGYEPGELGTDPAKWWAVIHPEDCERVARLWQRVADGASARYDCDYRLLHKDGAARWVEVHGAGLRDGQGRTMSISGTTLDVTARSQTEQALREREATLRTVFEHSPIGLEIFDKQGVLRRCNARVGEIFGADVSAHVGTFNLKQEPSYRLPDVWAKLERGEADQREVSIDFGKVSYATTRDGIADLNVFTTPIPDQVSSDIGYICQIVEVTELRRAERLQRLILDNIPDPAWLKDVEGRYLAVNKSWCEFVGISADRAVGRADSAMFPPELAKAFREDERGVAEAGELRRIDEEVSDAAGRPHWFETYRAPLFDGAGRVYAHIGIARDITARKLAEEKLRESETDLREAQRVASIGSWTFDVATRQVRWSDELFEIFGIEQRGDLLTYDRFLERVRPEDRAEVIRANRQACESGAPFAVEYRVLRPPAAEVVVREIGYARKDAAGRVVGLFGTAQDVTGRRRLEAHLRQAQKMEAIGQLAGGVAHDFNNVLAAITMQVAVLRLDPRLDAKTREALADMDRTAQRGAALTRQMLLFSRRTPPALEPLDLNQVVADALRMLERLIPENVSLRFDAGSDVPAVEADAGMLDQVLTNLAVNARDAMPRGGRITVATAAVELGDQECRANPGRRPGRFACLAVADDGDGMDSETLSRVFEPFFTTKGVGQGTGLGLATVHGIVGQHQGWVEVESEVGRGTTFRIYLPAAAAQAVSRPQAAAASAAGGGAETVLLVEDDPHVRRALNRLLGQLGYRVREAASGEDAIQIWPTVAAEVDLLLTDMVMPGRVDGRQLADHLRTLKPGLKVIISSGYNADQGDAHAAPDPGIAYLPKPYQMAALADLLRRCLDATDHQPAGRAATSFAPSSGAFRLGRDAVAGLPSTLGRQIGAAAVQGRYLRLLELTGQVAAADADLAAALRALVEAFDYAALQALFPVEAP